MTNSQYRWVIVAAGGLWVASRSAQCFRCLFSPAHLPGHRMVRHRRLQRHDHRLSCPGTGKYGLGHAVGSLGTPPCRTDRVGGLAAAWLWRARRHRSLNFN